MKFKIINLLFRRKTAQFKIVERSFLILAAIVLLAAVLRLYRLDTNPPGLYWDEAVFGYDAYSILKTAHDHHGRFLPLFFESFGDWKLPVYHYLLIPSIAVFGLTEFAVRFPSALLGTLTVLVFYFLVKSFTKENENQFSIAYTAALMLAISPWHIQFSRGGFESTAGLFFTVTGAYLFLKAVSAGKILLFTFAFLLLTFSMYSYHAYRIFVPLLLVALTIIYERQVLKLIPKILIGALIPILLLIPLVRFSLTAEGKARLVSQSAFKKEEVELKRLDFDQKSKKPFRFMSKYLYKEPIYYSYNALKGYISHFSPVFLFFQGDQIGRHSQVDMGQIYLFEALLIIPAVFLVKSQSPSKLMIAWLLLAPLPAAIVTPTPHAYRTLQMAIPLAYLSGLGAHFLLSRKNFLVPKILFFAFSVYWIVSYLHLLFVHYPIKFAADWQDGYRQMVEAIKRHQDSFEKVYITNINQVPYIYLLFYQKYDPLKFIQLAGDKDSFDKYVFVSRDVDIYSECGGRILRPAVRKDEDRKLCLYVAPSWEKVDGKWLDAANDSAGKHIYSLWEVIGQ